MDELNMRIERALQAIAAAASLEALDTERVAIVGKSGFVTEQLKQLGKLPGDQRKAAGERINLARDEVLAAIARRRDVLEEAALEARLAADSIDVTLPGRRVERANLHPVTRAMDRICDIFARLGYERADGPESLQCDVGVVVEHRRPPRRVARPVIGQPTDVAARGPARARHVSVSRRG